MNIKEILKRKKFAEKGFKLERTPIVGIGYTTSLEYFPCNYRHCFEAAIKRNNDGFYVCEEHGKERK